MVWAMFSICTGNSVDKIGKFSLLLSSVYSVRAFSASHTTSLRRGLGVYKRLGEDKARRSEQLIHGIFHTISHRAQNIELRKEEGREGHLEWCHLSSQVTIRVLLSWRWLNSCLPVGSGDWIPCLALLVCVAFVLPFKPSLSQHRVFSHLYSSDSCPIPPGEWTSSCMRLSCHLRLDQDSYTSIN